MNLHCIGINHRTAPVGVREKLWLSPENACAFGVGLRARHAMDECVVLATCNRTEVYYTLAENDAGSVPPRTLLAGWAGIAGIVEEHHFFSLSGVKAVEHLFDLASGIDSMVLGDVQILNQVKTAYEQAQGAGTISGVLNRLFASALHAGKRSRAESEISDGAVSVGSAAAELASRIFSDLPTKTALLVGAGETGELAATHLRGHNLGTLLIANRTRARAEELGRKLSGVVVAYEDIREVLAGVDIVITSVGAPEPVLTAHDLRSVMKARGNRSLIVIDLGVPRNVEALSGALPNVFLHDIDALDSIVDKNLARRKAQVPRVRAIVESEARRFDAWYATLKIAPTIHDLRERFESIRRAELEKCRHRFTAEAQEEVAQVTHRIVNKLLHAPTVNMKSDPFVSSGSAAVEENLHLVRVLFGLDPGRLS